MQLGLGAQPLLTLGVSPSGGAGSYRKLTFLCEPLAWRGTPASRAHLRLRKLDQGQLWDRTHPPCPAAAVPRAPCADPVPMAGPYFILPNPGGKCGRAPWGRQPPAAPRRARPAQSALPAHPQRSPAPRGAGAGEQHGPSPAGARSGPMVPGVPEPRSPLPLSFSASTEKEEARKGREREMIKLLEVGR